jgi:hypothetical protein
MAAFIINPMRCAHIRCGVLVLGFSILIGSERFSFSAETPAASGRPKLYDTAADGNHQIAQALKIARAEDKRLILKFGANW